MNLRIKSRNNFQFRFLDSWDKYKVIQCNLVNVTGILEKKKRTPCARNSSVKYFKCSTTVQETCGRIGRKDFSYPVQELDAYMYFRQEWYDPRLANVVNKTVHLARDDINLIWRPDTFSYNSRATDLDKEDKSLHSSMNVEPSGRVFYSRK